MKSLTTNEIRQKWLEFFESKGHLAIEPKSLIPVNDPSLLWINSGVATLKDYFTGIKNPPNDRLTNSQKSIRTNDIENVGVTTRHHTIFEMLGNFSIGDYFKEEAIEFGFELLTKKFQIPLDKLYFTVYKEDEIAYKKWISLGVSKERILKGNKDRNFWDVGQGPCGPCTEIFFDRGKKYDPNNVGEKLFFDDLENDRYIEIWNIVFSQFNNDGNNNYTELSRKNIDTGAGLERWACVFQDAPTNFDTDTYAFIINALQEISPLKYDAKAYFNGSQEQKEINRCYRVIADHIKANVFAIADGAVPNNKERGSILRRLIRRSMVCARKLKLNKEFLVTATNAIVEQFKDFYPYLVTFKQQIIEVLEKERKSFEITLDRGFKLFENEINGKNTIDTEVLFKLVDTYGFPYELIKELCVENSVKIDEVAYASRLELHRKISRANLEVKGMSTQATDLINLTVKSKFIYDELELKNSKIIAMFDTNFKQIKSSKNECWIVLDKTVLYATSGGQIHDKGIIQIGNLKFELLDAIKAPNEQHLHLIDLDGNAMQVNDSVDLFVNKEFRINVSRNHTVEHMLEHVLNKNIDSSIKQEGAFKTDTYFTFDFKFNKKLTNEELKIVEKKVNEIIDAGNCVSTTVKTHEEATQKGTVGHFLEKYKKISGGLRVVKIDNINDEICGGTHVKNTKDIQKFMISEYTPKGTGTWRIRGITSNNSISEYIDLEIEKLRIEIERLKKQFIEYKISDSQIKKIFNQINYHSSVENLFNIKNTYEQLKEMVSKQVTSAIKSLNEKAIKDIKITDKNYSKSNTICYFSVHNQEQKNIIAALNELTNENSGYLYVCFNILRDKIQYFLINQNTKLDAGEIIKKINLVSFGAGGGNKMTSQGGTNDIDKMKGILDLISKQ